MNRRDLWLRIRALCLRRRVEQELDEELQFHLEMAARKKPEALKRFGSVNQVKEECRTVRGTQWIETVFRDTVYALRGFRRNPLFVLTVVGTIALGLGLNVALFTIFNTYVLRPVSVPDPFSLYSFTWTTRSGGSHGFTWREFQKLHAGNPAFSDAVAMENVQTRMNSHWLIGQLVTGNYFHMLNGGAQMGRTLLPEDTEVPGRDPVIVVSYSMWQNTFGGDPNIIGRKVVLRGYPFVVIGVMREAFRGLESFPPQYWAPLTMAGELGDGADPFGPESPGEFSIVGRLKPGSSLSQATAALTAWSKQMSADLPEAERAVGAALRSKATGIPLTPHVILGFSPLIVAFGLVLLLACANVANMMLARAMARQREIGIRLSLGASRRRLIRQLLTESVLLAIPAGLAGFLVSRVTIDVGLRIMFATLPSDMADLIPNVVSLPPDFRVFAFMLIAALISAVLFGLAPAVQSTRTDVMLSARGEFSGDIRPMRLRNALVAGQITVCALILICSGVLIRGARAVRNLDVGFRTHGVLFIQVSDKVRRQVLLRLKSDPEVEEIASASNPPLNGILPGLTISSGERQKALSAWHNDVSPEFFGLLGIPILEGRNFTSDEAKAGAPVAIVSERTARSLWPAGSVVGREIQIRSDSRKQFSAVRVVGVTRNIISCTIPYGSDPPVVYFPAAIASRGSLLLRVPGDVEKVRRALVTDLDAMFPDAIQDVHPMDQAFALSVYPFRVASFVGSAVGGLALALTLSGIYGVLCYLITQRTKEIGIRMALGATTGAVTRLVLKQSGRLAAIGITLGTLAALGVSRWMAAHLVFVNTFDIPAYCGGVFLVAAAALGAAYIPSRRATRINPVTTLRYD